MSKTKEHYHDEMEAAAVAAKVITVTVGELVNAMKKYNQDQLENPERYGEIENTDSCAENQVGNLMYHLTEGHTEEQRACLEAAAVSSFIEYCRRNGVSIEDELYEGFLEA